LFSLELREDGGEQVCLLLLQVDVVHVPQVVEDIGAHLFVGHVGHRVVGEVGGLIGIGSTALPRFVSVPGGIGRYVVVQRCSGLAKGRINGTNVIHVIVTDIVDRKVVV